MVLISLNICFDCKLLQKMSNSNLGSGPQITVGPHTPVFVLYTGLQITVRINTRMHELCAFMKLNIKTDKKETNCEEIRVCDEM